MNQDIILKMEGICKSFNSVSVLKNVNFSVNRGEVHALMGENGAGKSTLIKILTGIYPKDAGKIIVSGEEVEICSRGDAQRYGIGVIYQELSLIPTLTVAQNILLGKERSKWGIVNNKKAIENVQKIIDQYQFDIDANAIVETLTIAQRQTVEIIKALSDNSKILIMDEPTASLSSKESENLFKIISILRDRGVSIIYISHRLEEVYRLSDRLTVLRDGEVKAVLGKGQIIPKNVIKLMIGKEINEATASNILRKSDNEVVLEVKNISRKGVFRNISIQVHKGEILGIGGLVGAGRTELIRCIFGVDRFDEGEIFFKQEKLNNNVRECIKKGFGFVPEDRRNQGFIPLLSIEKNEALTNYDQLSKLGIVSRKDEKILGKKLVQELSIKPNNPQTPVGNLSGGNQQKTVLGKWISRDLYILIIDEPTAGIDVGAKEEIYKILETLAEKGTGIIVVSSDLQELLRISQRIIVMRKGRIFREFSEGSITQEDILTAASGISEEVKSGEHE